MGGAGQVGSRSDNTVRAMATSRKTIIETVPDTDENSQCGSSQQTTRVASQTAIGKAGGVLILMCWQSTSTVYEEIPSVCSQSIDSTVEQGTEPKALQYREVLGQSCRSFPVSEPTKAIKPSRPQRSCERRM